MKNLNIAIIFSAILFAVINRIILPFKNVFTDYGIILNTPDAYCMTRYSDMLPYTGIDGFANYPASLPAIKQIIFPLLIKTMSMFTGDNLLSAAILPVILFAISAVAVYCIARMLFSDNVAALSLLIYCILPGEILTRTMLGAGDYHCLEIALVSSIIMLIVMLSKGDYGILQKIALIYIISILIAVYWLAWPGALMIIAILALAAFIYIMLNYRYGWILAAFEIIMAAAILLFVNFPAVWLDIFIPNLNEPIIEMQSFFFTNGQFDINTMMAYYGLAFYLILFGIGWIIYRAIKYKTFAEILFASFTLVIMAMMTAHRRFDYYFAISGAIITAFMIYQLYQIVGKKHLARIVIIATLIIALPLAKQSIVVSQLNYGSPDKSWINVCQWLKSQNTAEHEANYVNGKQPEYGVLAWWNYGYWLVSIGHQAVLCHGGTASNGCAEILLNTSDSQAMADIKALNMKYVIVDNATFNSIYLKQHTDNITDTFAYRLYNVELLPVAYQSDKIRIFEVTQ